MKIEKIGIKKIIGKKRIKVIFNKKVDFWERRLTELLKDHVILTEEESVHKKDTLVYTVFHLDEKIDICCDATLLKFGKFPFKKRGELFSTYGHLHERGFGECYLCLKNRVFLILTDKENFDTKIVKMKEGDVVFIDPKYMHRLTIKDADALVLGFVPKEAGHDYDVIKNKGFPYHIFSNGKIEFVCNEKYGLKKLSVVNAKKINLNPIHLFLKNTEKLREILLNPKKYKKIYV
jgi:oxalate decarboxylase/phosphoglucose isomerase-like protein (cupin superfamily)